LSALIRWAIGFEAQSSGIADPFQIGNATREMPT
jgi:hypothetical protein